MQVSEQAVEVREPAPEARAVLTARAGTQFGRIPGGLLVEHLERTYGGADWPVRREALEALLRRWKFAQRDDLEVARRPSGSVLGEYALRTPTRKVRPYRTLLASLEPLRGSCGCPDFRRGSLGLCKHLLVVLDDVAGRKNARRKGLSGRPAGAASRLEWDPVRPLVGADDWLERVRLEPGASAASRRSKLARRFTAGVGSAWVLRQTFAQAPQQRLELVRDLLARAAHDPALEARLREERGELERVLRLRGAKRSLTAALRGLWRPPYPYQREGVDCFLARGRLLLADDMGLGKTVQADCGLPRAAPRGARPARPPDRPRRAQAPVAARVGGDDSSAGGDRGGRPRAARAGLRAHAARAS